MIPAAHDTTRGELLDDIAAALAEHGLILRGGFVFDDADPGPADGSGSRARSVLLVGHAGGAAWPFFTRWRSEHPHEPNPLDTWARAVIGDVAGHFGGWAVSPSDRPYLPFQRWAMRAEALKASPLGILMHPRYGLWHAYRGAMLFRHELPVSPADPMPHLCDGCVAKPCLTACPVGAHGPAGFAHPSCLAHVRGATGGACRDGGCLDRNACPYGAAYRYPVDQQSFHMAAFAA